jgi:hypothetical protein
VGDLYFTFDVEVYAPLRHDRDFLIAQGATWESVLHRLNRAGIRTTFFVTGEFAQTYPSLFREMVDSGHEIASHTMTHRPYFAIGDEQFEAEIARSKTFLEDISQSPVRGFRAPLGQVPPHLAGLLQKHSYAYDSSIAATHIPGHFQALGTPQRLYQAALGDVRREDETSPLWEIPIAVTPGVPVPYGGFFLSFVAPCAWRFPRTLRQPHVMFSHPHDFMDMRQQRGCYAWDRWKCTRNNWRMLAHFCRVRNGADARLRNLLEGDSCL